MAITLKYFPRIIYAVGGDEVTFFVDAEGVAAYQWQVLNPSGTAWNNLTWSGSNTATMTRALNVNTLTYQYRCALTDSNGAVAYAGPIKIEPPTDRGLILKDTMTAIADAIRAKTATTDKLLPADMAALVNTLILPPDGITEIETVECAGSNTYTLTVPCGLSDTPACVAIYRTEVSSNAFPVQLAAWAHDMLVFWYGSGYAQAYANAAPLSSGVLTLKAYASSSTSTFNGTYRCVMWR